MKHFLLLLSFLLSPFSTFAQAQEFDMAMRKLSMATFMTNMFYVDSVDCVKLVESAINGMLEKLDPHSQYSNAKETRRMNESIEGSFEGIGVQFNMLEDTLLVIQTISKGPSEKVGILAGDRIVTVNDTAIAGVKMSREEIMSRLRGPKGTKVKLGIVRPGVSGLSYFTVVRDKIPLNTLDAAYMVTPEIGLIRFSSFGLTTLDEILGALQKLKSQGMTKLIIDLQQNGGGLLDVAAAITSQFIARGDTIVYTRGRNVPSKVFISNGGSGFQQGKLVVLIDEYSASAAEILTGAIQDQDRGLVVGRRSFGKGLVQQPVDLPDGSMIRLTVARYYTPSGRCIQKPYTKGDKESYSKDVINRYNSGELTNADSIHFPDSLKFTTRKLGRTVYGGGGIMPDYFIPLDTTRYTKYYRELSTKSLIINANLHHLDKNRKKLTKQWSDFARFKTEYETPDNLVESIFEEGEKLNIKPKDDEERANTIPVIKRIMKALTARDLWDMSEYFAIIYEDDPMVMKAVELLNN